MAHTFTCKSKYKHPGWHRNRMKQRSSMLIPTKEILDGFHEIDRIKKSTNFKFQFMALKYVDKDLLKAYNNTHKSRVLYY